MLKSLQYSCVDQRHSFMKLKIKFEKEHGSAVSMKKDLKCDCFSKKNNQLCLLRILMIPSKCNFDKGVSVVVPFLMIVYDWELSK